ncbi:MAG: hypothetical protein L0Z55_13165, partial [Planctomycetes bacterium]|nr:hypothetical protein [Planctomycetota bacterium]
MDRGSARALSTPRQARGAFLVEVAVAAAVAMLVVLPLCAEVLRQDRRAGARALRARLVIALERAERELYLERAWD